MENTLDQIYYFLSGAACLGAWTSGFFFFRFWKKTGDRLFWWFGVSFWLMASERIALLFFATPRTEDHSLVYGIRLVAFLLIMVAVINKNRSVESFPESK
jgi:hypothetical protein